MYYYKQINDEKTVAYQSSMLSISDEGLTEITEDEYNEARPTSETEIIDDESAEKTAIETLQLRVSELEAENAVLLFENLTGEVFSDV